MLHNSSKPFIGYLCNLQPSKPYSLQNPSFYLVSMWKLLDPHSNTVNLHLFQNLFGKAILFFSFSFFYFYSIYEPMQNIQNIVTRTNVCMYIVICNTVICLEYSIIMTTGNIYICTVRKSRHNNHKVMYS